MKIDKNRVVAIHYTLTDDDGQVLDSSEGKDPLSYLHGTGSIIPGLENALQGQEEGYSAKVSIKPEDGYGDYSDELVQSVSPDVFQGTDSLEAGMQFQAQSADGHVQMITIKEVKDDEVIVDANHPLAGQNLHFDVKVEGVREASKEELDHGHAH